MNNGPTSPSLCSACGRAVPSGSRFCPACGGLAGTTPGLNRKRHTPLALVFACLGFVGLVLTLSLSLRTPAARSVPVIPKPPPTRPKVNVPTPASTPDAGMRVFRDHGLGFEIGIPESWVTNPDGDGHDISPADDSPDSTEVWGTIHVIRRTLGDSLQKQASSARLKLQELPQLVVESEQQTSLSGHPAVRLTHHHHSPAEDSRYFGITIIGERDEGFCDLTFQALQERRQRYQPLIEQMIHSFRFLPIVKP